MKYIIEFPYDLVIQINDQILATEPGYRDAPDVGLLQGALGRISNAMHYDGLDDVFEIAAKYAASISIAHSFSDGNKRTALVVALEFLGLNDYEIFVEYVQMADMMENLVTGELSELEFADILYELYKLSVADEP